MESFAGSENESQKIHINQEKCETKSRSRSNLSIHQSTSRSSNNCLTNCCTGLPSPFRSRKSKNTSDISRSEVQWHRPLTNCMFDSQFKNTDRTKEFQIDQLIAKGAFGCVFKVFPKDERDRFFALKTIRKSKVIRNNCVKQIKDEADIQKLCSHHPFIVQHSDAWQDRRQLFILSEYVPNGELFSKLCKFTTELIRLYTAEIALAIDFLHNAGVIYRDAKPENILLTTNYHIKITDFGLSKWLKIGDRTRTMCGTYQYMAPEILRNEPYGHSVDWWALGVIVCQMYTTKCPDTEGLLRSMISVEGESQSPVTVKQFLPLETESLPLDGKDLLLRLLDINPKTRLHSVMGLQRIGLYKNFKLNLNYVQNISPIDIIRREDIPIKSSNEEPVIDTNF